MLLGLHSYSLYLHGIGENWAGFALPWPKQMDIWQLMDYLRELGLEGLHIDDGVFDSMEKYLNIEREALKRSVRYCREVLGIGME